MSIMINGTPVRVAQPLHSISVNKNQVVFADSEGFKNIKLADAKQTKQFVNWLLTVN